MADLRPLTPIDGYLPIEDYGLIGDGSTAALVGRDGSISWLCLPRFDSAPVFASILDATDGGFFRVAPTQILGSRQYYEKDSAVLVTEMRTPTALLKLTDVMALRAGADLSEDAPAGRCELVRRVEVLDGEDDVKIDLQPRGGAQFQQVSGGWSLTCPALAGLRLHLAGREPLPAPTTSLHLERGQRFGVVLSWGGAINRYKPLQIDDLIDGARSAWQRWLSWISYDGPRPDAVHRSAITLKLLDYLANGALVAAPTSSLPEVIGGERNWDYRYAWVRDASFSVYALRRIGLLREGGAFLGWVLDAVERAGGIPKVLYDLDGNTPSIEQIDPEYQGYRHSRPVRWGNAAAHQTQNDVYGEILDCAYQWMTWGGHIDASLWQELRSLVEAARKRWRMPDRGIWEVRTLSRPFTYSAALCHVALDRGARIAERLDLPGDTRAWRSEAERIRRAILEEAWDESKGSLTEHLGGGGVDASLLSLPLRRVIPADHPRMIATTRAVQERLGAGRGLIYRYLHHESPDGLPGKEGAFLLCSFWLVDNLAYQGKLDEAMDLFHSLCDRGGELGLLPEQIDPQTGGFLGNYPQAFSHIGLISSGVNLGRLLSARQERSA